MVPPLHWPQSLWTEVFLVLNVAQSQRTVDDTVCSNKVESKGHI